MASTVEALLAQRFAELDAGDTRTAWAAYLGNLDKGTLTRILNGDMKLTKRRAEDWGRFLFPDNEAEASQFAASLILADQRGPIAENVHDFFENMVEHGGWMMADKISDLFKALQSPELSEVLVCCEYRDLPRATAAARYPLLGRHLGEAIARGVTFAMFNPFGDDIPLPIGQQEPRPAPALAAAFYMVQVKQKCREGWKYFRDSAEESAQEAGFDDHEVREAINRIQLYEKSGDAPGYIGTGFQGKLFYITYKSVADNKRHHRIMQWISTPRDDLLIYRGQTEITPDAIRDSFFPIPHIFDLEGRLPSDGDTPELRQRLLDSTGDYTLPPIIDGHRIWTAHNPDGSNSKGAAIARKAGR